MRTTRFTIVGVLIALLTACASVGDRKEIPVSMPNGEKATIVAHDQNVPDWMLSQDGLALNYIVKGNVSREQLAAVAEAERACRLYTKTVRPNNLVAVLSSGVIYAIAGGVGVGLGAKALAGANSRQYAKYGAAAGAFAGAANGTITLGGQTYTFENCGREVLDAFSEYRVRVIQKSPY